MGTNYYAVETHNYCQSCGRGETRKIHIGKKSAGWAFAMHVTIPGCWRFDDMLQILLKPGVTIEDDYGMTVTLEEMLRIMFACETQPRPSDKFLENNCAYWSDRFGLIRRCNVYDSPEHLPIDLCEGDFS